MSDSSSDSWSALHKELLSSLDEHESAVGRLQDVLQRLEAAQPIRGEEAEETLGRALRSSTQLQRAFIAATRMVDAERTCLDEAPISATDLDSLQAEVNALAIRLEQWAATLPVERVARLIEELRAGTITPSWQSMRRDVLRSDAADELVGALGRADAVTETFPGPDADGASWMSWFWGLPDDRKQTIVSGLEAPLPKLSEWLWTADAAWWTSDLQPTDAAPAAEDQAVPTPGTHETGPIAPKPAEPHAAESTHAESDLIDPGFEVTTATSQRCEPGVTAATGSPDEMEPSVADDAVIHIGLSDAEERERVPSAPQSLDEQSRPVAAKEAPPTEQTSAVERHEARDMGAAGQVEAGQVEAGQVEAGQVEAGQVEAGQVEAGQQETGRQQTGAEATATNHGTANRRPAVVLEEPQPYDQFRQKHWLNNLGELADAPWAASGFDAAVVRAQHDALLSMDLALAWVAGATADELDAPGLAQPWLVEWLDALTCGGGLTSAHTEDQLASLAQMVREAVEAKAPSVASPSVWLGLLLLAVDDRYRLTDDLLATAWQRIGLSSGVVKLLDEWVLWQRQDEGAAALLREQIADKQRSPADIRKHLEETRNQLRQFYGEQYSAARGRIQRPHCRAAWSAWIEEVKTAVVPLSEGLKPDEECRQGTQQMLVRATDIFDEQGARFQDRNTMDRTARQLQAKAQEVIKAHDELARAEQKARAARGKARFTAETLRLIRSDSAADGLDGWILRLLRMVCKEPPCSSALDEMPTALLLRRPMLVDAWTDDFELPEVELAPRRVRSPVVAIARLLDTETPTDIVNLEAWLLAHQPELLLSQQGLSNVTLAALEQHRGQVADTLYEKQDALRELRNRLEQLADRRAASAADALKEIERAIQTLESEGGVGMASTLLIPWLDHVNDTLQARATLLLAGLVDDAVAEGRLELAQARALADTNQIDALQRAPTRSLNADTSAEVRASLTRIEAQQRWPAPLDELALRARDGEIPEAARAFAKAWLEAARRMHRKKTALPQAQATKLREALVDFVFDRTASRRKKHFTDYTPTGKIHYTAVASAEVRSWLIEAVGNPTFLPQLRNFGNLALATPSSPSSSKHLVNELTRGTQPTDLRAYLIPALSHPQRSRLRQSQAQGGFDGLFAALDDLDACRLLTLNEQAGRSANPLLAFLEVVSEQQAWTSFGPYRVHEGSQARMEMFVGRQEEAKDLAWHAKFDRIFSGRRLGKSALLKYLELSPNMRRLPSGNQLDIVFCSIAGMKTEPEVADAIVKELSRLPWLSEGANTKEPLEFLKTSVPELLANDTKRSLLVLLDEADAFFRAQTDRARNKGQSSLTWWMRSHAEQMQDSSGVARLRFVLCGYLYTDQNRGAWENKGACLQLGPLKAAQAARLVAAPLARLGIDARPQADNIAFRCGHQPAVIIRFGLSLLDHLSKTRPIDQRERVVVNAEDVSEVFLSDGIQSAIEETCWLNVVGRPQAQLVLAALLLELKRLPPGAAVEDAPASLLRQIREVEPSFEFEPDRWGAGSWHDAVLTHLRALVVRSLVAKPGGRREAFRLRIANHLPVLAQRDLVSRVRAALRELGATSEGAVRPWILSGHTLEAIAFGLGEEAREIGQRAVALVSQWQAPLVDTSQGLASRVGIESDRLLTDEEAMSAMHSPPQAAGPLLLLGGVKFAREAWRVCLSSPEVEFRAVGRLTMGQLLGWFTDRRAIVLPSQNAYEILMRETAGIPLVVGALDAEIQRRFGPGGTIDEAQLDGVVTFIRASVNELAARIIDPSDELFLTERERQLVHIVHAASIEFEDELAEALRSSMVEGLAYPPYDQAQDDANIGLLLALGLLPQDHSKSGATPLDNVVPLRDTDPALRLCRPA